MSPLVLPLAIVVHHGSKKGHLVDKVQAKPDTREHTKRSHRSNRGYGSYGKCDSIREARNRYRNGSVRLRVLEALFQRSDMCVILPGSHHYEKIVDADC